MLSKSMRKYGTENILSQYVQRMGNNGTGATQSAETLQHAFFLVVDEVTVPSHARGDGQGRGNGQGGMRVLTDQQIWLCRLEACPRPCVVVRLRG